jgi:hypothetical protein
LVNGATWTLEEILGSIPDLKRDFENCYPKALTYTIPVQVVRRKAGTLERFDPAEVARYQTPQHALRGVNGLGTAYLPPQYKKYLALYRRIDSADIGTYSILGQKSLVIAHLKNGQSVTPSQLILMHMGLFALGHISRYRPQIWNPFVRTDETGERLVIEKFLGICQRYLPNLVLNEILHEQIQFVYEVERGIDLTASLTDSDLRDMEDRIVKKLREEGGRQ